MKIMAVTRPIPTEYAERIYNDNKTVFVGKTYPYKVSEGDKFIIYESRGAKAYTGWADIKFIGNLRTDSIFREYGKKMMITEEELKEYANNRPFMTIIEFENFEKFNKPVKPKRFVIISGKYIYEDEYSMILKNKDY